MFMTKLAEIMKKLFSLIMSKITKILQKRSSVENQSPRPEQLDFGEIAINFNANNPYLSIKDSASGIVEFHVADQALDARSKNPVSNSAVTSGITEAMKPLFIEVTSSESGGASRSFEFVGYTPQQVIDLVRRRNVIIYYGDRTFTLFEIKRESVKFISPNGDKTNMVLTISQNGTVLADFNADTNVTYIDVTSGSFTGNTASTTYEVLVSLIATDTVVVFYDESVNGSPVYGYLTKVVGGENGYMDFMAVLPDEIYEFKALQNGTVVKTSYPVSEGLPASAMTLGGYETPENADGSDIINSGLTITEAFSSVVSAMTDNELVTSAALNDLNTRLLAVSGEVSDIDIPSMADYVSPANAAGNDFVNSGMTITEAFSSVVSAVTDNTNAIEDMQPVIGEMVFDGIEYLFTGSSTVDDVVNAAKDGKLAAIVYDNYTYKLSHNWLSGNAVFYDFICVKDMNTVSVIQIDSSIRPYAVRNVTDNYNVMMFYANENNKITSISFEDLVTLAMDKNKVLGIYNNDTEDGYEARDRYTYFSFDCVANGGDLPNGYVKFTRISSDYCIVATCTDGGHGVIDVSYETYYLNGVPTLRGYVSPENTLGDDILDSGMTMPDAFEAVISAITDNELTVSASINELNDRVDAISGAVEGMEVPSMADYESPENVLGDDFLNSGMTMSEAFESVVSAVTDNELIISSSLNDLNTRVNTISGAVENIEIPSMADYESPANTLGDDVISSGMTITQAFEAVVSAMANNELVTSNALNDLRDAIEALEQRVTLLES